jgi:hypothetical protein
MALRRRRLDRTASAGQARPEIYLQAFLDRDLYVFCFNASDGNQVANGNPNAKQLMGVNARTIKDATGKAFGEELYAAYQKPEGEISQRHVSAAGRGQDASCETRLLPC